MDKITITGITGFGFHGVLEHERRDGQTFSVDLEVITNFDSAVTSDDVRDTVNYAELADIVHAAIVGEPVNLIEKLANQIATDCLDISGVTTVTVTVHKPQAPIPVPFTNVSVSRTLP
ncbi:MAG: Dihydroneopterin aldolase [Actinomycetota bacterium]